MPELIYETSSGVFCITSYGKTFACIGRIHLKFVESYSPEVVGFY